MSDMKCPVCDSYLHKIPVKEAWVCGTHDTKDKLYGSKELWQELIRIRKALDVAKDTLCWYDDNYDSVVAMETIKEITALEQKDVK